MCTIVHFPLYDSSRLILFLFFLEEVAVCVSSGLFQIMIGGCHMCACMDRPTVFTRRLLQGDRASLGSRHLASQSGSSPPFSELWLSSCKMIRVIHERGFCPRICPVSCLPIRSLAFQGVSLLSPALPSARTSRNGVRGGPGPTSVGSQ